MRNIWLIFFVASCLMPGHNQAQQILNYENTYAQPYIINPAALGAGPQTEAGFLVQKSFTGFPGSPLSQVAWIGGSVDEEQRMGVGIRVYNQSTFGLQNTRINFSGSYEIPFTENSGIIAGLSIGMGNQRVDYNSLNIQDPTEEIFNAAYQNKGFADGDAGLEYRSGTKLRVGLAISNMFSNKVTFEDQLGQISGMVHYSRHYTLYSMYDLKLNEQLVLQPVIFLRSYQGLPAWMSMMANVKVGEKWNAGLSWQSNRRINLLAGCHLNDVLKVNYAFGINNGINQLASFSSTQHEVMFQLAFGKRTKANDNVEEETNPNAPYEQIDQLAEQNKKLQDVLDRQKKQLDEQQKEIDRLKTILQDISNDPNVLNNIRKSREWMGEGTNSLNLNQVEDRNDVRQDYSMHTTEGTGNNSSIGNGESTRHVINSNTINSGSDNRYYVIAGVFREVSNARSFQKIFQRETGRNAFLMQEGRNYYYVAIGQALKRDAAIALANELNTNENVKRLIAGNVWVYVK